MVVGEIFKLHKASWPLVFHSHQKLIHKSIIFLKVPTIDQYEDVVVQFKSLYRVRDSAVLVAQVQRVL